LAPIRVVGAADEGDYARYLAEGSGPEFEAAGVTDVDSFTGLYWGQQASTAGVLLLLTTGGALLGGLGYGFTRPKSTAQTPLEGTGA